MSNETKCYKIRDKRKPGLWKKGGGGRNDYAFSKSGKTWSSRSALGNHLALHRWYPHYTTPQEILDNWEIVEFSVSVTESGVIPVKQYLEERKKKNDRK